MSVGAAAGGVASAGLASLRMSGCCVMRHESRERLHVRRLVALEDGTLECLNAMASMSLIESFETSPPFSLSYRRRL